MTFETPLCELAYRYKTDKCPQINHSYTPFYYSMLKDKRHSFRKVVELGIGFPNRKHYFVPGYQVGASLYMWRDFFPLASIYGADINPATLFKADRIDTFLCDGGKEGDLLKLIEAVGTDIDMFIDDGSHRRADQVTACKTLMPLLKKGVVYIIEDVNNAGWVVDRLPEYNCHVEEWDSGRRSDRVIVVRNKE